MKIFGMGTDSDFYDCYTWFYPNAHKIILYQFFLFSLVENLKFLKSNSNFRNFWKNL